MSGDGLSIRFGLVGCGTISAQHFAAINSISNAELISVCDIVGTRARAVAERYGIEWYTDYKKLLEKKNIDVISICTPNWLHTAMAIEAAQSGKHALIEKPIGLTADDVRAVDIAFLANRKKAFPVLQVRYNPPLKYLKWVMLNGGLGKIHNASLVVRWNRPQAYFDKDEWRGTKVMDGGTLLTQGIHYVDVLQWLLGPVESVFAVCENRVRKIEVEDMALAILKFKSGARATLEFNVYTYPHNLECSISVLGSRGSVKIGGTAVNEIECWEVENIPKPNLPIGIGPNVYAGGLYTGSCPNHVFVYEDLVRNLLGKPNNALDIREALNVLRIIDAIYRSASSGTSVKIDGGD